MGKDLPYANLTSEQMGFLAQAEQELNAKLGGKEEIIILAYKNEK
ncbi:hypothetical protein [Heliorestis convoluta]|uniref:Uncharacterized protein n=1 Tax=Heliorestis convoluta TaxID=356322 RepID=A0A5Q2MYW9_9FIRM|nr:hypothetical protein [Heliorestis convoluta]QGG46599.1 hypothetical protein FTV88_0420 [Heliorestis convoluta]